MTSIVNKMIMFATIGALLLSCAVVVSDDTDGVEEPAQGTEPSISIIHPTNFGVGQEFVFSVTTHGSHNGNVVGTGSITPADENGKIWYYEVNDGQWYELSGNFGPPTGFPFTDGATSIFKVQFSTPGSYQYSITIKDVTTEADVCSAGFTANVASTGSTAPIYEVSTEQELRTVLAFKNLKLVNVKDDITINSTTLTITEPVILDLCGNSLIGGDFPEMNPNDKAKSNLVSVEYCTVGATIGNGKIIAGEKNRNVLNVFESGAIIHDLELDHTKATNGGAPLIVNKSTVSAIHDLTFVTGEKSWYAVNISDSGSPNESGHGLVFGSEYNTANVTFKGTNPIGFALSPGGILVFANETTYTADIEGFTFSYLVDGATEGENAGVAGKDEYFKPYEPEPEEPITPPSIPDDGDDDLPFIPQKPAETKDDTTTTLVIAAAAAVVALLAVVAIGISKGKM